MKADLDDLARRASAGDRHSLGELVRALQRDVFALALRMLWTRQDAEDATQEILVRVVTRLSQFDGKSSLRTWVYRVATNYLLDVKKTPFERQRLDFRAFADDLADGASNDGPADGERSLLVEEVRLGCTLGMLQCLDRPHRLAYILGDVLGLSNEDAAAALDIGAAAYRKRLQRARNAVVDFTREHCGLVSDSATCRCNRRTAAAVRLGRVDPAAPAFAERSSSFSELRTFVQRAEQGRRALELFRLRAPRDSTVDFAARLLAMLEAGHPRLPSSSSTS